MNEEKKPRIGLIVPSTNTVMEPEFAKLIPTDRFTIHVSRMKLEEHVATLQDTVSSLARMKDRSITAAELLADARVNTMVYGCTSGSFYGGAGTETALERDLENKFGIECVTTASAVIHALHSLKISKLCFVSPYTEDLNKILKKFLEHEGFLVLNMKGVSGVKRGRDFIFKMGLLPPTTAYTLAKEVDKAEANGLFISCTNFRSIEIIERLEKELQKPVVSSNIATCWYVLKRLGYNKPVKGYGKLLESLGD